MINKHPGMFVMCKDVADVIASVNFGRENNLLIAVRGGGHNGGGLGICNDGLVIDLSGIKFVRVDTSDNTVRVGGGNLWGEVDHATHAFGLAVPAGIISTTGVGGLTSAFVGVLHQQTHHTTEFRHTLTLQGELI